MSQLTISASSILSFAERNGIGESTVYKEIKAGRLVARKIGRRTIITDDDERIWRNSLPRFQALAGADDAA
jgi:hypothetical protein